MDLPAAPRAQAPRGAAVALGFALGGFFDGILLHQVLQWHHLLSAVDSPRFADLRVQVLADGLFHAAMYAIAAWAVWRLLAARHRPPRPGDGLRLAGDVLMGFGAWHTADAVLSHWLLGLHRIRMDTAVPLAWDLGWWAAFGALPLWAGWRMLREAGEDDPGDAPRHAEGPSAAASGRRGTAQLRVVNGHGAGSRARRDLPAWIAATVLAGLVAAQPAPGTAADAPVTVVVRDGAQGRLLAALGPDAAIVGSDRDGTVWQLRLGPGDRALDLYRHGALWVAGGAIPFGCAARTAPAR